jgi:hypothetical protein
MTSRLQIGAAADVGPWPFGQFLGQVTRARASVFGVPGTEAQ